MNRTHRLQELIADDVIVVIQRTRFSEMQVKISTDILEVESIDPNLGKALDDAIQQFEDA